MRRVRGKGDLTPSSNQRKLSASFDLYPQHLLGRGVWVAAKTDTNKQPTCWITNTVFLQIGENRTQSPRSLHLAAELTLSALHVCVCWVNT